MNSDADYEWGQEVLWSLEGVRVVLGQKLNGKREM